MWRGGGRGMGRCVSSHSRISRVANSPGLSRPALNSVPPPPSPPLPSSSSHRRESKRERERSTRICPKSDRAVGEGEKAFALWNCGGEGRRAGRKDGGGHTHTRAESGARNCSTGLNSVADGRTRRAPFQHKYC